MKKSLPTPSRCSTCCFRSGFISARSATAAAPSSRSTSFLGSTAWRLPKEWYSPAASEPYDLILGLNRMALAEGMVFAERVGLDLTAFLKVARASAAYAQVMDTKGQKMISGDFSPQGYVKQHLKDVHLMLDQAQKIGQKLPLLEVHADALEACVRHGEGETDNCIIIEEIRRRVT